MRNPSKVRKILDLIQNVRFHDQFSFTDFEFHGNETQKNVIFPLLEITGVHSYFSLTARHFKNTKVEGCFNFFMKLP